MCECGQLHVNKRLTIEQDPTRQGANRNRAFKDLSRRIAGARAEIRSYILQMFTTKATVPDGLNALMNREVYTYQPDNYAEFKKFAAQVIAKWFETGGSGKPPQWFFEQHVVNAYKSGTAETIATVTALMLLFMKGRQQSYSFSYEQTVLSYSFQLRMQYSIEQSFNSVEKMANDLASDLARTVGQGTENGNSPAVVAALAGATFDKIKRKAKMIADNEVNNAYRKARENEAKALAETLGVNIMVLHRSALLPTTRAWHAARHGKIFTIQAQAIWWASDANWANCYCSVSEVIVGEDGTIYDAGAQKKMIQQRRNYFKLAA
jgi:uncharacterized protein YecT (DUF1311 family)